MIFQAAVKSLWNRRVTTLLTMLSIALSTALLLGIERIHSGAKKSFQSTVSGVDLIVGAAGGPINLLLYSVFRIGDPTKNISYQSYEAIRDHELVQWTIPISLGDSHKGYRVIGTNLDYFKHYRYGKDLSLTFSQGSEFRSLFHVVLGSEVAKSLKYRVGDKITLSHGTGEVSFQDHKDKPFEIKGILRATGTPVDRSLHVSLKAITALHVDWQDGAPPLEDDKITPSQLSEAKLKNPDITAFFLRLKQRIAIFSIQREVNDFEDEPLMAILPGVSLNQMWQTIGVAEKALFVVSLMVFFISLVGIIIALIATLNERRREMAIYRSVGAKKSFIFSLLIVETVCLGLGGIAFGSGILYAGLLMAYPVLKAELGMSLGLWEPSLKEGLYLIAIMVGAIIAGLVPAYQAYRNVLADGLMVKH